MLETSCLILLSPILAMAAAMYFSRRPKKASLLWRGPKPAQPLVIPSAEETAEAIRRFREAAERAMMSDFIWHRYSKGRALFLEQMRQATGRRIRSPRPGPDAGVPEWL